MHEHDRIEGFICMTAERTWGWGTTPDAAVKQARKQSGGRGARKGERYVYQLPTGAVNGSVDGFGRITWDWANGLPTDEVVGTIIEEPVTP